MSNGIAFCRVDSWLTGSRLVSVPFADHCQPLVSTPDELPCLLALLRLHFENEDCRYLELRPLILNADALEGNANFAKSTAFYCHGLDLRPDLDTLFNGFHKSCVQRKIRRAEREGLVYEDGRSEALLRQFYRLLIRTRRRHGVPTQPLAWFRNLVDCLGEALKIRMVCQGERPVAAILTLQYKNTLVYKYGASDAALHHLGGMPVLFWRTIQEAKRLGAEELDLGRSDVEDRGLIDFKRHLGAEHFQLHYYRYPPRPVSRATGWTKSFASKMCARLPISIYAASSFFYRHLG
jgi:hypothetical protein